MSTKPQRPYKYGLLRLCFCGEGLKRLEDYGIIILKRSENREFEGVGHGVQNQNYIGGRR